MSKVLTLEVKKSTIRNLEGKRFIITSTGIKNGLRDIQDGKAYFGTGNSMESGINSHSNDVQTSFFRTSSLTPNDVVIKSRATSERKSGNRIFEIDYKTNEDEFILKDCGKLGVFVKMTEPIVSVK